MSADVVVVGGGLAGLPVALRAAQRGLSVVVLDAGGPAAWPVAAGMLAPVTEAEAGAPELLEAMLAAAARWPAFAAELGVELHATGTLVVARDAGEAAALDREAALREALGLETERLLPTDARAREPALAPRVRAALHVPGDHSVDPRAVVEALARAARAAGAEVRRGCEVVEVGPGGARLHDGTHVAAGRVVLAAGAAGAALGPLPVRAVKGQTVRLRGAPLLGHVVRYETGYVVPRRDGRVVVGATVEERADTAVTAGGVLDLLRDAAEVVPGLLELELEACVAGLRPATADGLPVLGAHPGAPWLVHATGHFRNGVLLAPLTGDLVAAELAGERPLHPFTPDRLVPACR